MHTTKGNLANGALACAVCVCVRLAACLTGPWSPGTGLRRPRDKKFPPVHSRGPNGCKRAEDFGEPVTKIQIMSKRHGERDFGFRCGASLAKVFDGCVNGLVKWGLIVCKLPFVSGLVSMRAFLRTFRMQFNLILTARQHSNATLAMRR